MTDRELPRHYWKGRPREEMEAYHQARYADGVVASWIGMARDNPDMARWLLWQMAGMLRDNQLPDSGRQYLADALEKIVQGGDLTALLPRNRKRKAYTPGQILGAVEREKMKLGQERADRFIYDSVGRQFGIKGSTAAKEASVALSNLRKWAAYMHAHGSTEESIIDGLNFNLGGGLPPDCMKSLLLGPLFGK